MSSLNSHQFQRSIWSPLHSVDTHHQVYNDKRSIDIRSNKVASIDNHQNSSRKQSITANKKQGNLSKCWSSIPPCVRGFVLGILATSSVLVIIVPIWLTRKPTSQAIASTPVLRWKTTGITIAGTSGVLGNASNQLNSLTNIALDYANNLYIADFYNHRVQKYMFGSSIGITIAGNGTSGSSMQQLNRPSWLVMDSNENLYISNAGNHRIQLWQKGALNGTTVAGITGSCGTLNNQLCSPYGIVLDSMSNILYVSDYGNQRIMSYALGSNNGTLALGGNGVGLNNTQLYGPIGLYFDFVSNSLIIANLFANNIVRHVLGTSGWTLVAGDINGLSGNTSTLLKAPSDVTFDPMGNMYIADSRNHRVQFFYNGQSNGTTIAGLTNVNDSKPTTLSFPYSVRLDSQLNLYVADCYNHRIQKFLRY